MERRIFMARGTALVACLGLGACNHYFGGPPAHAPAYGRRRGGPPPHAPAHGYRRKHRRSGVNLVFDSGLGVYRVPRLGHYFHRGKFYRWRNGRWHISAGARGPWRSVAGHAVPSKLFKSKLKIKGKGKFKGKGKGKFKGKFKGAY